MQARSLNTNLDQCGTSTGGDYGSCHGLYLASSQDLGFSSASTTMDRNEQQSSATPSNSLEKKAPSANQEVAGSKKAVVAGSKESLDSPSLDRRPLRKENSQNMKSFKI